MVVVVTMVAQVLVARMRVTSAASGGNSILPLKMVATVTLSDKQNKNEQANFKQKKNKKPESSRLHKQISFKTRIPKD